MNVFERMSDLGILLVGILLYIVIKGEGIFYVYWLLEFKSNVHFRRSISVGRKFSKIKKKLISELYGVQDLAGGNGHRISTGQKSLYSISSVC